jgi:CRP-like cAMP-binding protein
MPFTLSPERDHELTEIPPVTASEPSELIVLHRSDFFEILRKEAELAVKLLWQFLGVLADRLDQTSRDLSSAREELNAEDITDAIFDEDGESDVIKQMASAPEPRDSFLPGPMRSDDE